MTELLIVDVSANQDHPINWAEVKKAGVHGAILKATQGTNYFNPFFEEDLKGCNDAGIPVMAYHFAMFEDVAAEVAWFKKYAGVRARALDIETSTNLAWANTFLKAIRDEFKFADNETMLYGSSSNMGDIRRGVTSLMWVANYSEAKPPFPCACYQYSESGHIEGIANHVDLSHWTGTQKQFDAFFSVK
jgi:lysozyme